MRALPFAVALILAVPATVAVAFPRALPDIIEPVALPTSGGDARDEHAHEEHASEPAREAPAAGERASPAHAGHGHERTRTSWPPAEGAIPSSTKGLVEVRDLLIEGKPDLDELEELGIALRGKGTLADPYVLEGLWVRNELEIKDTSDFYVVRDSVIGGTLRLNWNGDRVHVHHNDVRDLRVNENIERVGEATGGLIELNRFGVVGQIRHFDGVFRANEVGPIPSGFFDDVIEDSGLAVPFFANARALNIDGFDGAVFEDNRIFGYVEMQLHGHHHASCFACHSHNHAVAAAPGHDHTIRYHEADFVGNLITVEEGVAFRYTDAAHSGDDRTATSEPNKMLREPHVHFTRLAIERNVVEGGPMVIDILNADSRDHKNEETDALEPVSAFAGHAFRAELTLRDNEVAYAIPEKPLVVPWLDELVRDGILVREVKEARVDVAGNVVLVSGAVGPGLVPALPGARPLAGEEASALRMSDVRAARLVVDGNAFEGAPVGIRAERFDEGASWELGENLFRDVEREVEADAASRPDG